MYSQFRVDDTGLEKATKILEELTTEGKVQKYFIALETAHETGKLHNQGWTYHNMLDNSYRKRMARYFTKGSSVKCFTKIKDETNYIPYIIKNVNKMLTSLPTPIKSLSEFPIEHYITNYDETELIDLYNNATICNTKKTTKTARDKTKSFFDKVYEKCEEKALIKGIDGEQHIMYSRLPDIYLSMCGKQIDNYIFERNLNGITNKLEVNYPNRNNRKLRSKLLLDLKDSRYGSVYF